MVLLPDPLGPISPSISPGSTANDTSFTAVNPPKRLVSPSTVSTAQCRDRSRDRPARLRQLAA